MLIDRPRMEKKGWNQGDAIGKGYTLAETEVLLSIEENTVRRWENHYLQRKHIGLFPNRHGPGYEGKLNQKQRPVVSHYVDSKLLSETNEIRHFIPTKFGLTY